MARNPNTVEQAATQPEWLKKETTGKPEAEAKVWSDAYTKFHSENVFKKNEGPAQAVSRLQHDGFLTNLKIVDEAHKIEKTQGKDGQPKTVFHINDRVYGPKREHEEVSKYVENFRKGEQANRIAPATETLTAALTPERQEKLKKLGMESDPQKLHDKIVDRLRNDKNLTSDRMSHMKDAPVGAPYVASGAITGAQMDSLLREQKAMRDVKREDAGFRDLKQANPEEYKKQWGQYLKDTDMGNLLRVHAKEDPKHYSIAKIQAADSLIHAYKDVQRQARAQAQDAERNNARC